MLTFLSLLTLKSLIDRNSFCLVLINRSLAMWRISEDTVPTFQLHLNYCEIVSDYPNDFNDEIKTVN